MSKLSHKAAQTHKSSTVVELIERGARRLRRARVCYGHGTDNARDDAAALVWHVLELPVDAPASVYRRRVGVRAAASIEALITRRIEERMPTAYLTGVTWFAGLAMHVDERVLIPRSPIAELIERRFEPWVDPARLRRVLDLGTGSGCIAIACALALPHAQVDAADISPDALAVAALNVRAHRVAKRVRLVQADHFAGLGRATYDMIVSNPPYVGEREMRTLPAEYRHEPRLALASGRSGLDSVGRILSESQRRLRRHGVLIVEVGNTQRALERRFPRLPFTWFEFERGGGGVFMLTREQLLAAD